MNTRYNSLLAKSKNKIFNNKDGHYCQTVTSSSQAPVTLFTKPRGNMMEITGLLVGKFSKELKTNLDDGAVLSSWKKTIGKHSY